MDRQDAAQPRIILASGSKARAALLSAAGVAFEVVAADVDEVALYRSAVSENDAISPGAVAALLARAKAAEVSLRYPDAVVIGGDQVLALGSELISKAADRDTARQTLTRLKGEMHTLYSAAALASEGRVDWSATETAVMTMRNFSPEFLEDYLDRAGEALVRSVGAYEIEGLGINLFQSVVGHHTTILGLPLLPLLAELRQRNILIA